MGKMHQQLNGSASYGALLAYHSRLALERLCQEAHKVCRQRVPGGGFSSIDGDFVLMPEGAFDFTISHDDARTMVPYWVGCHYFQNHGRRLVRMGN